MKGRMGDHREPVRGARTLGDGEQLRRLPRLHTAHHQLHLPHWLQTSSDRQVRWQDRPIDVASALLCCHLGGRR